MGRRTAKSSKISALLKEAIETHPEVEPEEIRKLAATAPKHIRRVRCFGRGFYWCSETGHAWTSHRAMFSVDMKKEKLQYIFGQRCAQCRGPYKRPSFSTAEMTKMVEYAVDFFLRKCETEFKPKDREASDSKLGKPHKDDLCEACEMGCCMQPSHESDDDEDGISSKLEQLVLSRV